MAETKAHRDAAELLSLLNDTDFRREAAHILDRLWAHWSPPALPSLQEFNEVLQGITQEYVAPFVRTPPQVLRALLKGGRRDRRIRFVW